MASVKKPKTKTRKRPRRKKRGALRYVAEDLWPLYVKHRCNLHAVLRNERGPGIPSQRRTWQGIEKRNDWVNRYGEFIATTARKADEKAAEAAATEQARDIAPLIVKLHQIVKRELEGLVNEAEKGFEPETFSARLNALRGALKDLQFLGGGPSDRSEVIGGYSLEELEGVGVSADALMRLRRSRHGVGRVPALLPDDAEGDE